MPIYEYRCRACGHELEKLQKLSEPPLEICPSCNKPALSKLISAAGFRLAGSGWYETDFKKDKRRNLAGDGAAAGASSKADNKENKKGSKKTGTSEAASTS